MASRSVVLDLGIADEENIVTVGASCYGDAPRVLERLRLYRLQVIVGWGHLGKRWLNWREKTWINMMSWKGTDTRLNLPPSKPVCLEGEGNYWWMIIRKVVNRNNGGDP